MTPRTKKIAAALAAVDAYLAEEAAASARCRHEERPVSPASPWMLAGRLAAMGARLSSRGLARG
ncbi:MAG: hypothetical protein V3R77_08010 [Candidatus Binatia bacterium]